MVQREIRGGVNSHRAASSGPLVKRQGIITRTACAVQANDGDPSSRIMRSDHEA